MKIYVASPFAQKERVQEIHKLITKLGMEFTSRWAEEPIMGEPHEIAEKAFQMDRADLARSNALLALIDIPGGRETFAEIEVARHTGIPIVFVGKPHISLEREWMRNSGVSIYYAENVEQAIRILYNNCQILVTPSPYYEFANEREKQDLKWGEQNHPSIISRDLIEQEWKRDLEDYYDIPGENAAKMSCQRAAKLGICTWADIALEEFCEAVYAKDETERRKELVQLGAVITAWIECIDRKKANCDKCGGIGKLDDRGFKLVGQPYFDLISCSCMK